MPDLDVSVRRSKFFDCFVLLGLAPVIIVWSLGSLDAMSLGFMREKSGDGSRIQGLEEKPRRSKLKLLQVCR